MILEEHSTCENEDSKGKQVILSRFMNFLIRYKPLQFIINLYL